MNKEEIVLFISIYLEFLEKKRYRELVNLKRKTKFLNTKYRQMEWLVQYRNNTCKKNTIV